MSQYPLDSLESFCKAFANNHAKFESFGWHARPDNSHLWGIYYTHHRDSGLLDQSNASVISKALDKFTGDDDSTVVGESHNHWAVGWIEGYSILVYDGDNNPTEAVQVLYELLLRLDDYPILDEEDYSEKELDATGENVRMAVRDYIRQLDTDLEYSDDIADKVNYWLGNYTNALENRDDQGGWPSDDDIELALVKLGILAEAE